MSCSCSRTGACAPLRPVDRFIELREGSHDRFEGRVELGQPTALIRDLFQEPSGLARPRCSQRANRQDRRA